MYVCIIDAIIYTGIHGSAYMSGNMNTDHLKLIIMRLVQHFHQTLASLELSEQAECCSGQVRPTLTTKYYMKLANRERSL